MYMKMKHWSLISGGAPKSCRPILVQFALSAVCVVGFVETSRGQGSLSAQATLTETGRSGNEYNYTLILTNTGSNPINAFWYGWIVETFDLPSVPTNIKAPTGWTSATSSQSIRFGNSTGSAIPSGGIGIFTFESTNDPTAMTSGTNGGTATGNSVAYATVNAMGLRDQSDPGIASDPFIPTLQAVPVPAFQTPAVVAGSLHLTWTAFPGVAYQTQYSTNLAQTNWIKLGSAITATNNSTTTNEIIGSNSLLFYRVVFSN
jgi:hypothetical protein